MTTTGPLVWKLRFSSIVIDPSSFTCQRIGAALPELPASRDDTDHLAENALTKARVSAFARALDPRDLRRDLRIQVDEPE